ncbi:hydroxyethylthiazole kinase-like uncharacterized protein yjeF/hydroxyethylthiazole kinase-like uncharacterized protein yjeF [Palleronia aestuarii]|uniref:Bifunctional NAD(P)H-hydrate repair enzyme n=1 Tax=Palleronia aestuarii TaxID=568105 RepID=A0A2W7NBA2_9RHOB|nr:NAD(P)H-hydrate dehydratase [Palleronia aestuarii]PZX17611.1 hydroxyethylthiazole kinase-like uncharacterized protein yjeF/hydroxyethylthiazole kinase-like uncharacterized protein yjeF [Palleronia aestuarii]
MADLLTSEQMRAVERDAIDRGAVTGLELMERAGRAAVDAIFAEWPELERGGRHALILCGPGNNGGDGFVVARLLAERHWMVRTCFYGNPDTLPPDARTAFDRWEKVRRHPTLGLPDLGTAATSDCDLIVDALFGIGLSRPLEDDLQSALNKLDTQHSEGVIPRVALDIVSGLCADSGRPLSEDADTDTDHLRSRHNLTVAFHAAKPGHYLSEGPDWCGKIRVVDIGLGLNLHRPEGTIGLAGTDFAFRLLKGNRRDAMPRAHKYDYGHALVLSGGVGRGGAARMAARGALRVGAGLVTVGCPPAALIENAARLDAIMLRPVRDAEALLDLLSDARINAVAIGPGLGTAEREAHLVDAVLGTLSPGGRGARSVVLDGDALTLLSKCEAPFALLTERCVLTPHAGEFARLFPDIAGRLGETPRNGPAYSKVDAVREAAARARCVVLLKGPDTVIADAAGNAVVNAAAYERYAPWLATAGSGDVLAGFVAGLLARGFPPMDAAAKGAWLHIECALAFGPGLVAEDLPEQLPSVFARLAGNVE